MHFTPRSLLRTATAACLLFLGPACVALGAGAPKKVLLVAGQPSHGPGAHEHNAGMLLLQKCLAGVKDLRTEVVLNGELKDAAQLRGYDAIIVYSDGQQRHVALQGGNLALFDEVLSKGVGLGLLHYATEPTLEKGHAEFLKWVGGAFEIHWSVNPHWDAEFKSLPSHPITRGVKPFTIRDEWYFNLRFVEGKKGVTPLLVAVPDVKKNPEITARPDHHHWGNPAMRAQVARGEPQTVSWAFERADGGRGFGFTGGHFHANWGHDDFRKLVLNAILWLAKMEVPAHGVASQVTPADLEKNLDPKPVKKAKAAEAK